MGNKTDEITYLGEVFSTATVSESTQSFANFFRGDIILTVPKTPCLESDLGEIPHPPFDPFLIFYYEESD